MAARPIAPLDARVLAGRVLETAVAGALLAVAVRAARDFRVDAVREFRFTWGTWGAAVALAFAAGAVLSVVVWLPSRRSVVAVALGVAALALIHLPAVLAGGVGLHRWPPFATTTFVDGTGPQLLAAVVAGAGVARLAGGASVRRGRGEPVE
jgi:hypothetical protein